MHSCIRIVLENEKQEVASVPVKGQLDPPKCEGGIVGSRGGERAGLLPHLPVAQLQASCLHCRCLGVLICKVRLLALLSPVVTMRDGLEPGTQRPTVSSIE